ncbi:MAG: D-alanyl-D-alanine carboxypeptidase [Clostridia bacterium]|nr:D-alanyl-D-alanine carboxypeptidase [Clostridia bacterium]
MKTIVLKRILPLILAILFLLPAAVPAAAAKDPIYDIALDSQGVYLVNPETGTVLYEKNAELRMCPASITKVMTALVVLGRCDAIETAVVTVPDTALFAPIIEDGGVHMEMRAGEVFTVRDLLLGMLMNSFCDAAHLLAWHFGGQSVETFVELMNRRAEEIGMENTHFANAHGLNDPDHWSCPRDLAKMMEEAVKDPRFVELIRTRDGVIPATAYHKERKLTYTVSIFYPENEYYLDAFVGGKSGFTDEAGRCLASSA